jgi:hypothetical protein
MSRFSFKNLLKYNGLVESVSSDLCVDSQLVNLRDALAHGRVSSNVPQPPLRLLKFDKTV